MAIFALCPACSDRETTATPRAQQDTTLLYVDLEQEPVSPIGNITRGGALGTGYFLLDYSLGRIVTFDSAGRHLRTIGRLGSGPGEFRMLLDGVVDNSDKRLAVLDPQTTSISIVLPYRPDLPISRFPVPPSLGNLGWCCGDSLLVFVPFGRPGVTGSADTLVKLFNAQGEQVNAFGRWPEWTNGITPGIAELKVGARGQDIVLAEVFGRRLAWYRAGDDTPTWTTFTSAGVPMAVRMDSAARAGASPSSTLELGWMISGLWIVGRDSVVVRSDSIVGAGERVHRYSLMTPSNRWTGPITTTRILSVANDEAVVGGHKPDGEFRVARKGWRNFVYDAGVGK